MWYFISNKNFLYELVRILGHLAFVLKDRQALLD